MMLVVIPWMVPVSASPVLWDTNVITSVTSGSMAQGVPWIAYVTETTRRVAATGTDSVLAKVDTRYAKQIPLWKCDNLGKFC